jgi:hypothetical protein
MDVIEYDDTNTVKQDLNNILLSEVKNREIISNILKFDYNKEIYSVYKVWSPNLNTSLSKNFLQFSTSSDIFNLLKTIEYENFIPKNINYLDSSDHYSYTCMHIFASQLFIPPEEFVIMTSSDLIYVSKIRPIDILYGILSNIEHEANEYNIFINEYGLNETCFMLITIMCNKNFVFYKKYEEIVPLFNENPNMSGMNSSNILMMDTNEIKNSDKIREIARAQLFKLIDFSLKQISNLTPVTSKEYKTSSEATRYWKGAPKIEGNTIGQPITDIHTTKINCKYIY